MKTIRILLPTALILLASCASKKDLTKTTLPKTEQTSQSSKTSTDLQQMAFVQKVYDNQVYAQNIVGNMTFTLTHGDKDITVPGALRMRKDVVIRLQVFVPLLGSEVGRIDFTPDGVLIVDRMHKEYIQAKYSEVDFLNENGISFYTLQSLFWNQLFLPGQQKVGESDLKKFSVNPNKVVAATTLSTNSGKMTCSWNANKTSGQIVESIVEYVSGAHGKSTLDWKYADFTAVGTKMFPKKHTFSFATTATRQAQTATVDIEMNGVKNDNSWDTTTTVSPKYKKVDASTILKKLTNM